MPIFVEMPAVAAEADDRESLNSKTLSGALSQEDVLSIGENLLAVARQVASVERLTLSGGPAVGETALGHRIDPALPLLERVSALACLVSGYGSDAAPVPPLQQVPVSLPFVWSEPWAQISSASLGENDELMTGDLPFSPLFRASL